MPTIDIFRNEPKVASFSAGEVIFRAGDAASEMFAIIEGAVEIVENDTRIRTLQISEIFGEMALIDSQPRSATAVAQTDCKVAVIGETRFMLLVQQTPFFALQLMRVLADRLRRSSEG